MRSIWTGSNYEQPYYLEPDKSAMKAYALLRDALESSGKGCDNICIKK
jgi:non-homologous end joining protein Ku